MPKQNRLTAGKDRHLLHTAPPGQRYDTMSIEYPPGQPWPGFLKERRKAFKSISRDTREMKRFERRNRQHPPRPTMNRNRGTLTAADLGSPLHTRNPELFTISTKGIGKMRGTTMNNTKGKKPKRTGDPSRKQRVEILTRRARLCKHGRNGL